MAGWNEKHGRWVRLAEPGQQDRQAFAGLWHSHIEEIHAAGGDVPLKDDNAREFLRIYDSYVQGSLFGFCILAALTPDGPPVATVLFGEDTPGGFGFDLDRPGKLGFLWGVHVLPEARRQGLAWAMQDWGKEQAVALGFRWVRSTVITGYPLGEANAFNWGAKPIATLIEADLHETDLGRDRK